MRINICEIIIIWAKIKNKIWRFHDIKILRYIHIIFFFSLLLFQIIFARKWQFKISSDRVSDNHARQSVLLHSDF